MACPCSRILRAWTMNICGIFIYGCLQTWLSDFTLTFHFHALKKEMATRSTGLAWRIPGTGEPGRLPSMGSHRVRHNWSDLAAAASALVSAVYQSLNLLQNSLFHCCSVAQSGRLFAVPWTVACRLPCPSPSPRACSNSCPVMPSTHPILCRPFSSCPQSFPASGSFPMSWLFTLGGQSIGALASVLPMNVRVDFL